MRVVQPTTTLVCVLVVAVGFLNACDDGMRGELAAKPIYGDMSALYYGAMCGMSGQQFVDVRINAIRISINDGKCAVLYLGGVDQSGGLLTYPGGRFVQIDCPGLIDKVRKSRAHSRVVKRVLHICNDQSDV